MHGVLKRLISLAFVLSVLREKHVAADLVRQPSSIEESLEYSHTTRNVYQTNFGGRLDKDKIDRHLGQSRQRFETLANKIDDSMKKGHYVHVEDGESDDYMQNIMSLRRGVVPQQVYLQGGHYEKRYVVANKLWDYLQSKFGLKKPEIFTISAEMNRDKWEAFDKAEGATLLPKEQIEEFYNQLGDVQYKELIHQEYKKRVAKATEKLDKTLRKNDFTTIALKTAPPAELVDVLEKYRNKVAIIWAGPFRKQPTTTAYGKRFNYAQQSEAGDKLVNLQIPTIVVNSRTDNARMTSIIDEKYMSEYEKWVPPVEGFKPFKGFKLADIKLKKEAMFSNYFFTLADTFRDEMIQEGEVRKVELDDLKRAVEQDTKLRKSEMDEKLKDIANRRVVQSLGERWKAFKSLNTEDETFREFCPLDQTVELVTDKALRSSVQEVLEVRMAPDPTNKREVLVRPEVGGNTFIISKFDSEPLEKAIQAIFDWVRDGEPAV